jgi:hypothetical protein
VTATARVGHRCGHGQELGADTVGVQPAREPLRTRSP